MNLINKTRLIKFKCEKILGTNQEFPPRKIVCSHARENFLKQNLQFSKTLLSFITDNIIENKKEISREKIDVVFSKHLRWKVIRQKTIEIFTLDQK